MSKVANNELFEIWIAVRKSESLREEPKHKLLYTLLSHFLSFFFRSVPGMDPPVLQTINDLAQVSRDQVEVSSTVISALDKIVKELSEVDTNHKDRDYDSFNTGANSFNTGAKSFNTGAKSSNISTSLVDSTSSNGVHNESSEILIAALERERLEILSDIQKHEYIGNQLRDILDPNQKLVADIKHYLARRHQIHANDVEENDNRLVHYESSVVKPTIEKLDNCTDDLHKGISMYKDTVQTSLDVAASTSDTLTSLQFKQKLDALIDVLNNLAETAS